MATATQTLHIRLLGTFSLTYGEEAVAGVNTPRLQSLLAYLVLHRDTPQLRQHLAFQFWPDAAEGQARNNLRQALHALRLALPDPTTFLASDASTLRWRPDAPCSIDVAELERALAEAETIETAEATASSPEVRGARRTALERAAHLFQADLLPSCYDEWIAPERERLRLRFLRALDRLVALLEEEGDHAAAIGYARRVIRHDALNENAYRRLMRLLALAGDRAGALRVYHACATALQRELGIAPSVETRQAYERLVRAEGGESGESGESGEGAGGGAATPAEPRGARSLSIAPSLIGREREWERLRDAWQRACAHGPGFALVSGEAGIGKSRLAEELLVWAGQQGATTAKARCYAAEGRLSLAPVTDWLRSEGPRAHLTRLDSLWLTEVSRVLPELLAERRDLLRNEPISEYGQRQRFFEALARAVLAAPQPLLLLIDDLQWCDEETLEWLHFLLRFGASARLLVVGSARAEEITPEHPLRTLLLHLRNTVSVTEITPQPLDAAETARLGSQLAHRELDVVAAMRLYHETEGNPLFVVETMRAGLDALPGMPGMPGMPGSERERSRLTPPDEGDPAFLAPLPPRVRAVIAGRLAQLSAHAHDLAALAATIGRAFRLDVLAHAAGTDEDAAVRALDELWQKRIVREQGVNTYDFTHDKLREVAYAEISAPQRRLLHRRIAQALEAVYADDLDPVSAQIAAHFERAGLAERAIPAYQRAATVAQRVYANDDAISLLTRALTLLDRLPGGGARDARELTLLLALAPIYRVIRGWTAPELERVLYRILALCDTVGTDEQRAEALYGFESLLVVQAKLERVQLVDEELGAVYARMGRTTPLSGIMLAGVRLHLGHIAEADEAYERIFATDDRVVPRGTLDAHGWSDAVLGRAWQSHALWCLGYPERALSRGREAVQIASDMELPFNQALATTYLALLQQLRADHGAAREQAEAAYELTVQYKAPYYRAWASILLRYAEAWDQPDADHIARLRAAIEELKETGARLRHPYYLGLLARLCRRADHIEDGLAVIDEAMAESRAHNERWWDAELHRLRGELLWARGTDVRDVETALLRARAIAREQRARSLELRAATSLARLWGEQGRTGEARRMLDEMYGWFTEGFETPDLRRARTLLARLA
jgi:DNA-binding SARP family transcriptional activator/tetratricopeptide (TPR) repeat protein